MKGGPPFPKDPPRRSTLVVKGEQEVLKAEKTEIITANSRRSAKGRKKEEMPPGKKGGAECKQKCETKEEEIIDRDEHPDSRVLESEAPVGVAGAHSDATKALKFDDELEM